MGPRHRGVVGRRAGSVADYNYSAALKNSGLTWDEATLDRWLTNPSALVPGTKMFFKLDSPQDRADVIAYLKGAGWALSRRASNPVAPRLLQRWAGRFAAIVRETAAAAGEIVLFLWTILVLGFALLIAAGFLA